VPKEFALLPPIVLDRISGPGSDPLNHYTSPTPGRGRKGRPHQEVHDAYR